MIRLSLEQVVALHDGLISATGGDSGLRDKNLLESALNAPFQSFDGVEPYPSLQHKAARLCVGLVNNHAFVDGNKRIGAHTMLVFLALNGIELEYEQSELSDIIMSVAKNETDTQALLSWINSHQA